MLLPLCACGKKKTGSGQEIYGMDPAAQQNTPPVGTPKISERYNSIDDADKGEKKAVREELLAVAEGCRDIYLAADKGSAMNAVLSDADVAAMVRRIGELGCSAVDYLGTMDMVCPDPIQLFGATIEGVADTSVSYYTVYRDGQISVYHLGRSSMKWYLIAMSAVWDRDGNPSVITEGRYVIGDVKFTRKGYLIYTRDTDSFDDNQKANTINCTFVRVLPYSADKRALCDRYITPIGYFENNLFTTTWSAPNYNVIDFNSLFAYLFGMYNGLDTLLASNASAYYEMLKGTNLYLIPTANFEAIVQQYFNIDSFALKAISDYSPGRGGYYFYGYADGIYNVTPRTPEPEVTDYWYNSDGTLTMRVDAVNKWYGTDCAFTHEVTVYDDGTSFRYVANRLYESEDNILPETRLSNLLNAEKAKLR